MTKESIVGPDGGDVIRLGPATVRILEDGSTTGHRLGIGEITVAPQVRGPAAAPARPARRGLLRGVGDGPVHDRRRDATTPRPGRSR